MTAPVAPIKVTYSRYKEKYPSTETIKTHLSFVNDFYALFKEATRWAKVDPKDVLPKTPIEVIQLYFIHCVKEYDSCDDIRRVKFCVNFNNYPEVNVSGYDTNFGQGTACLAIQKYEQLPNSEHIDPENIVRFPLQHKCFYFKPGMVDLNAMSSDTDVFVEQIEWCRKWFEGESKAESFLSKDRIAYPHCSATAYTTDRINPRKGTCDEVLQELQKMDQWRRRHVDIDELEVCVSNSFENPKCKRFANPLSIETTEKILRHAKGKI